MIEENVDVMVLKEGLARQKVHGGKLLIVKLKYSDRISEIQILGDFFIFPEDALPWIEQAFVGMRVNEDTGSFSSKMSEVMRRENIELMGITSDAVAQTIKMAIK